MHRTDLPVVFRPVPVTIVPGQQIATIAFERAVSAIKRDAVIAVFPDKSETNFRTLQCNLRGRGQLVWENRDGFIVRGWEVDFARSFYETMSQLGFNLRGDPTAVFRDPAERESVDYLIGARLVDLKGNFCQEHDLWYGRPQGKFAGEFYEKIEWTLYSPTRREVVKTLVTEGYGRQVGAIRNGSLPPMVSAFASATEQLAANKEFRDLMFSRPPLTAGGPVAKEKVTASSPAAAFDLLSLKGVPLSKGPITAAVDQLKEATVTVRRGRSHGSGFLISSDGHLLTNHHVVGDATRVLVIFNNGMEVEGEVVRSDKIRDVALVKVPVRNIRPLPMDAHSAVRELAPVYAVGSPADEKLKTTITRGIISAFRKVEGLNFIQSDAAITGGNSGGPLLEENGNVIGICVMERIDAHDINLFIPVAEALDVLKIQVVAQ